MLSGCKCYNIIIWKQLYDGSSKVVVTYIVAVHNKVPPHPCPSDGTNQRHTCVRHLVGVVAVAVFALGKFSNEGVKQDAQAGL